MENQKPIFRFQKCHKVLVEEPDSRLVSCSIFSGILKTEYKIGQWAEGNKIALQHGFGLFVVNTLDEAVEFATKSDRIYECICNGELVMPTVGNCGLIDFLCDAEQIDYFYNNQLNYFPWPEGTRNFKYVKLLKKIS